MDELYLATISGLVPGLGRALTLKLVHLMGTAEAVYRADKKDLQATHLLNLQQINSITRARQENLSKRLDYLVRKDGMRILTIEEKEYPISLKQLHDPPLVLYVKGSIPREPYRVAIVGSRNCTPYGIRAAEEFAEKLAYANIPIISGGAKGIDSTAHRACLASGGQTVAVMGCGLDVAYPPENEGLFRKIAESGAVISEYPPTTPPRAINFPQRNRIIVGLSQAVIVAEAALNSGASITANIAADEGREVYCVPGNIFDGTSAGCNELIRNGACLVTSPEEILSDREHWQAARLRGTETSLFDYSWPELEENINKIKDKIEENEPDCSELGKELLTLLKRGTMSLEELVTKSGKDMQTISMELLDLQMAGFIKQDYIGNYCRV
ncbi:MAG: DNA-processing protein DprA [Phascolarctobacterium sp.]|nr:DNA-processing protein DprA [Phascolarctobacterium sp.]